MSIPGSHNNLGVKWGEGTFDKAAKAVWMKEYNKQYKQDNPEKVAEWRRISREREKAVGRKRTPKPTAPRIKAVPLSRKEKRGVVKGFISELKAQGCSLCGYRKCLAALEFHHVGNDKEAELSRIRSKAMALREAAKCIVVCANCHREIHAGQIEGYADVERAVPEMEEPPLLRLVNGG